MLASYVHYRVHFAPDSGIVNGHDGARPVGDGILDLGLVDVHGIRSHVHEHKLGTSKDESRSRGRERIRGKYHLIARPQVAKERSHLKRGGTGSGKQRLLHPAVVLEPAVTAHGKRSVSADLAIALHRFSNKTKLGAHVRGNVEWDHICFLFHTRTSNTSRWLFIFEPASCRQPMQP